MGDEMNFSTQWGLAWTYASGKGHTDSVESREVAERILRNVGKVSEEDTGLSVELVWRGVTPWMKALI